MMLMNYLVLIFMLYCHLINANNKIMKSSSLSVLEHSNVISITKMNVTNYERRCLPKSGELFFHLNKKLIRVTLTIDLERIFLTSNNSLLMIMEVPQIITWKRLLSKKNKWKCFEILFSQKVNSSIDGSQLGKLKLCNQHINNIISWENKFNEIKNCLHNHSFNTSVLADFDRIAINEDSNGLAHLFYKKLLHGQYAKNKENQVINESMKRVKTLLERALLKKQQLDCKYEKKLKLVLKDNLKKDEKRDLMRKIIENNIKRKQEISDKFQKLENKNKKLEVIKNVQKKIKKIKKKEIEKTMQTYKAKILKEKNKIRQVAQNLIKLSIIHNTVSYSTCNSRDILKIGIYKYSSSICKVLFKDQEEKFLNCLKPKKFCNLCCEEKAPFFDDRRVCISECQKIINERNIIKKREKKFNKKLIEISVKLKKIESIRTSKYISNSMKSKLINKDKKELKKFIITKFKLPQLSGNELSKIINIIKNFPKMTKCIIKRSKEFVLPKTTAKKIPNPLIVNQKINNSITMKRKIVENKTISINFNKTNYKNLNKKNKISTKKIDSDKKENKKIKLLKKSLKKISKNKILKKKNNDKKFENRKTNSRKSKKISMKTSKKERKNKNSLKIKKVEKRKSNSLKSKKISKKSIKNKISSKKQIKNKKGVIKEITKTNSLKHKKNLKKTSKKVKKNKESLKIDRKKKSSIKHRKNKKTKNLKKKLMKKKKRLTRKIKNRKIKIRKLNKSKIKDQSKKKVKKIKDKIFNKTEALNEQEEVIFDFVSNTNYGEKIHDMKLKLNKTREKTLKLKKRQLDNMHNTIIKAVFRHATNKTKLISMINNLSKPIKIRIIDRTKPINSKRLLIMIVKNIINKNNNIYNKNDTPRIIKIVAKILKKVSEKSVDFSPKLFTNFIKVITKKISKIYRYKRIKVLKKLLLQFKKFHPSIKKQIKNIIFPDSNKHKYDKKKLMALLRKLEFEKNMHKIMNKNIPSMNRPLINLKSSNKRNYTLTTGKKIIYEFKDDHPLITTNPFERKRFYPFAGDLSTKEKGITVEPIKNIKKDNYDNQKPFMTNNNTRPSDIIRDNDDNQKPFKTNNYTRELDSDDNQKPFKTNNNRRHSNIKRDILDNQKPFMPNNNRRPSDIMNKRIFYPNTHFSDKKSGRNRNTIMPNNNRRPSDIMNKRILNPTTPFTEKKPFGIPKSKIPMSSKIKLNYKISAKTKLKEKNLDPNNPFVDKPSDFPRDKPTVFPERAHKKIGKFQMNEKKIKPSRKIIIDDLPGPIVTDNTIVQTSYSNTKSSNENCRFNFSPISGPKEICEDDIIIDEMNSSSKCIDRKGILVNGPKIKCKDKRKNFLKLDLRDDDMINCELDDEEPKKITTEEDCYDEYAVIKYDSNTGKNIITLKRDGLYNDTGNFNNNLNHKEKKCLNNIKPRNKNDIMTDCDDDIIIHLKTRNSYDSSMDSSIKCPHKKGPINGPSSECLDLVISSDDKRMIGINKIVGYLGNLNLKVSKKMLGKSIRKIIKDYLNKSKIPFNGPSENCIDEVTEDEKNNIQSKQPSSFKKLKQNRKD